MKKMKNYKCFKLLPILLDILFQGFESNYHVLFLIGDISSDLSDNEFNLTVIILYLL